MMMNMELGRQLCSFQKDTFATRFMIRPFTVAGSRYGEQHGGGGGGGRAIYDVREAVPAVDGAAQGTSHK